MRTVRFLGLCLTLAMGCGGDGGAGPSCDNVAIQVSAGTTPTFTWNSSVCPASELSVLGPNGTMWAAYTVSGGNNLGSPVRYGEMPPTCQSGPQAKPLVPGTEYQVWLFDRDWFSGSTVMIGSQKFTP